MRLSYCFFPALLPLMTSCTAFGPKDVVTPSELTVEAALRDLGKGFSAMKQELRKTDTKLGLFPCNVIAKFNVTASAGSESRLVIDASSQPTSLTQSTATSAISTSAKFEQTDTAKAERGNTIEIAMTSVACLPKDTLATLHPDKVRTVTEAAVIGTETAPYFRVLGTGAKPIE